MIQRVWLTVMSIWQSLLFGSVSQWSSVGGALARFVEPVFVAEALDSLERLRVVLRDDMMSPRDGLQLPFRAVDGYGGLILAVGGSRVLHPQVRS